MNRIRTSVVALVASMVLVQLAACGQKGPLVLPPAKAASATAPR